MNTSSSIAEMERPTLDLSSQTFAEFDERLVPGDNQSNIVISALQSPLGPLVAAATADGVCLLEFTDRGILAAQIERLRTLFRKPIASGTNAHLQRLETELASYFAGKLRDFSVPVVFPGTDFQQRVWQQLLTIPYGATRSYQDMAIAVGDKRAVRAVGRTNGLNRICIVIPCHRVINKRGALGGYGGGLSRKQALLELERIHAVA